MWILKRVDGVVYPLFTKSEHVIGRDGNLDLSEDSSVSRIHASINITLKNRKPLIILKDLGSKYGTYLNDGISSVSALCKSSPIKLEMGDRIRFGLQSNIWILEESHLATSTSMLSSQDKTNLKKILNQLKVDIVSDWNENCSHLTMTEIKTTVKAIFASVQVKPIVTLNYWKVLAAAFSGPDETLIPNCDDFIPPIAEPQLKSSLINLKMNKNRKTIFQGFKFIIFNSSQLNSISPIVETAGGIAVDGNSMKIKENEICNEKTVVVQNNCNEASSSNALRVLNILNSNGLRAIKEIEIYLSIFECSTERYCNSRFDASVLLQPQESPISIKAEATVLPVETQNLLPKQETQFLETASGNFSLAVNEIIVFSESDDEDIIMDTEIISGTPPNAAPSSTKRKLAEIVDGAVKAKNAKLDNWLLNRRASSKDTSESSASESVFSASSNSNKKTINDMFKFRTAKKDSDRTSSNLFAAKNDSSLQSVSLLMKDESQKKSSRTGSLFAATSVKSSENVAGDKNNSRMANLFANVGTSRSTRSSNNRFGSREETDSSAPTTNSPLGKRKHEDTVDDASTTRSRTANLFGRQTKRSSAVCELVSLDSDDESEAIARKTSKLAIANDLPVYHDSPVDVPSKMSMSQFQSAPAKENVTAVKTEAISPNGNPLEKSVVYTVPLIQNNSQNMSPRRVNNAVPNFKTFRKNNVCYPTTPLNGTKLIIFCGRPDNGFGDD